MRETASRRARYSASVTIGARRAPVRPSRTALTLGLEPGRAGDAAYAVRVRGLLLARGSRTLTTVLGGSSGASLGRRAHRFRCGADVDGGASPAGPSGPPVSSSSAGSPSVDCAPDSPPGSAPGSASVSRRWCSAVAVVDRRRRRRRSSRPPPRGQAVATAPAATATAATATARRPVDVVNRRTCRRCRGVRRCGHANGQSVRGGLRGSQRRSLLGSQGRGLLGSGEDHGGIDLLEGRHRDRTPGSATARRGWSRPPPYRPTAIGGGPRSSERARPAWPDPSARMSGAANVAATGRRERRRVAFAGGVSSAGSVAADPASGPCIRAVEPLVRRTRRLDQTVGLQCQDCRCRRAR